MFNKITVMGRLTADPILRTTQSGVSYATFSIACERDFTDKNGERGVDFINCVAWRGTAEFVARYFFKGRMMFVDGSLRQQKYTDRDGNARESHEILVDRVYFADSKQRDPAADEPRFTEFEDEIGDEELPF